MWLVEARVWESDNGDMTFLVWDEVEVWVDNAYGQHNRLQEEQVNLIWCLISRLVSETSVSTLHIQWKDLF